MTVGAYDTTRFRIAGDRGLLVEYGDAIDPDVNTKVRVMARAIEQEQLNGLLELVPTYRSLMILYDLAVTDPTRLTGAVRALEGRLSDIEIPAPDRVEIPVCYGGEFGPDMTHVGRRHGLTERQVIDRHAGTVYRVYLIGFTPGFPYMGILPHELRVPRLETPRTMVPAGSVGIANEQTGIYPVDSPGGWNIIGRTPFRLFDPMRQVPFLLKAGDLVRFVPIGRDEYDRMAEEAG